MLANNVKLMSKEIVPTFSADDVAKIKKFCKTHSKVSRKPFCDFTDLCEFTLMGNVCCLVFLNLQNLLFLCVFI